MKLNGSVLFEREKIQTQKNRWLNFVKFPTLLENIYCNQYRVEAAYEFRYRAPIILILYLFLSLGIYQILPPTQVWIWFSFYSWVGVIILIAWTLSFFHQFNQYFDLYAGIGSMLAVAISFILITTLESGQNNVLYHVAIMYAIVIIYAFVGLRFYTANLAGWIGGFIGIVVSLWLTKSIEWTLLNRTYTSSSLLGMSLAYFIDRQHRENYLQNCIIEINQLELTKQAEQLSILSKLDALTGLANRRYLDEILNIKWQQAQKYCFPISIIMIDIDHFKLYNDSLGHLEGDKCLQKIALVIASLTSRSGELATRYGGEEFLLLLPATNQEQAKVLTQRLMQQIEELAIPHPKSEISCFVTVSAGLATLTPRLADDVHQFITQADQALYLAKINGRNQYHAFVAA